MKNIVMVGQFGDISGYGHAARCYFKTLKQLHEQGTINLSIINYSMEHSINLKKACSVKEIEDLKKYSIDGDLESYNCQIELKGGTRNTVNFISKSARESITALLDRKYEVLVYLTPDWIHADNISHPLFSKKEYANLTIERLNLAHIVERSHKYHHCVVWETTGINKRWQSVFNAHPPDKIICASEWNNQVFQNILECDSTVIPYCFENEQTDLQLKANSSRDIFTFYYIGAWTYRKAIDEVLLAYFMEFKNDPVNFVLKTDSSNSIDNIKTKVKDIKQVIVEVDDKYRCRLKVINEYISSSETKAIHETAHCYISATRGEGFGIPIANAIMNENPVIVPNKGGHIDYISSDNYFIECYESPVINMYPHHYSSSMNFYEPNILSIKTQMRSAYEEWKNNPDAFYARGKNSKEYASKYLSIENNIALFKKHLEI